MPYWRHQYWNELLKLLPKGKTLHPVKLGVYSVECGAEISLCSMVYVFIIIFNVVVFWSHAWLKQIVSVRVGQQIKWTYLSATIHGGNIKMILNVIICYMYTLFMYVHVFLNETWTCFFKMCTFRRFKWFKNHSFRYFLIQMLFTAFGA